MQEVERRIISLQCGFLLVEGVGYSVERFILCLSFFQFLSFSFFGSLHGIVGVEV